MPAATILSAQMLADSSGRRRAIGRGLALVEPGDNELIAFAAAGGTEAADGTGTHSPFTAALLKHIETPGLEVRYLFAEVRDEVLTATNRQQAPHQYGTLGRDQIFLKTAPPQAPPSAQANEEYAALRKRLEDLEEQMRRQGAATAMLAAPIAAASTAPQASPNAEEAREKAVREAAARKQMDDARAKAQADAQAAEAERQRLAAVEEKRRVDLAAKGKQEREARENALQAAAAKKKAEEVVRAKLDAEAESRRVAALNADTQAQAKAVSASEAKRASGEAERQRLAALNPNEYRQKAAAEAKRRADDPSRASFDGAWTQTGIAGNSYCKRRASRRNLKIAGQSVSGTDLTSGSIGKDGSIRFVTPNVSGEKNVIFTGKLSRSIGHGSYRVVGGKCIGTFGSSGNRVGDLMGLV